LLIQSWQKNLAILFAAELMAMLAFSFVDPLVPLQIQRLGGFTTQQAAFWSGVAASGLGIVMFFVSPIWGIVADRIGKKSMLQRAMFGGAFVLFLIGIATSPYLVVGLRFMQGSLTGSVAASTALCATLAPRNRLAFSIGMIMVAVFVGGSAGPFLGGLVAEKLNYQTTFFISAGLLLIAGVGVSFLIHERFERPARGQGASLRSMFRLARSREMLPLLMVLAALNLGPSMVGPMISLMIKDLSHGAEAASASGLTFSLMNIAAAISSFVFGRMAGRFKLQAIMVLCCVASGVLYLPPIWAGSIALLALFLAVGGLFRGGISTSSNAIVGLSVPRGQEGIAYGLAQSASSLGGGLGPLIGGSLASTAGFRSVFGLAGAAYIVVGLVAGLWVFRRVAVKEAEPVAEKVAY
jgi:MFS transporter, DHA1 family, multidrug resistance protein